MLSARRSSTAARAGTAASSASASSAGTAHSPVMAIVPPVARTRMGVSTRAILRGKRWYSCRSRLCVPRAAKGTLNMDHQRQPPQAEGLYDPRFEHDACGVAMVARLDNEPSHEVIDRALTALENLEHRGAEGADVKTGDGAGMLTQIPDAFFRAVVDFELPDARPLRRRRLLPPARPDAPRRARGAARAQRPHRGPASSWAGARSSSTRSTSATPRTRRRPYMRQLFIEAGPGFEDDQDAFERKLYVIRRIVELAAGPDFYSPSFSSRTIVYKGMLISHQLRRFFPDLQDERFASALALVHSRFSTNTFPSWELAHPYRVIAHNGEINTLMGNVNWMRARESQLASELFGIDLQKVMPIVRPGGSDSATFDNVLELLMLAGRSLPHAVMMMIPEAYRDRDDLPGPPQGLLRLPLLPDGAVGRPGRRLLHRRPRRRRDARPQRPAPRPLVRDRRTATSSSAPRPACSASSPANVKRLGRLAPGKLFLVDLEQGRIVEDEEVKREVATQQPYGEWFAAQRRALRRPEPRAGDAAGRSAAAPSASSPSATRRRTCASCSRRWPRAARSRSARWATTTRSRSSPTSARRCSATSSSSSRRSRTRRSTRSASRSSCRWAPASAPRATCSTRRPSTRTSSSMDQPILRNHELETLRQVDHDVFRAHTIDITWPVAEGPDGMQARLANVCDEAHDALEAGVNILILSDRARRRRARADPVAAGGRRGPPPPRARGHAPARGPRARVRRAARGPPLRDADRLRRQRDQPVPACSTRSTSSREGRIAGVDDADERRAQRRQGDRQGPAQDDLEDGDLDGPVLLRRADLRGRRPGEARSSTATSPAPRRASAASASRCSPRRRWTATPAAYPARSRRPAAGRRHLRLAPRRRAPHVEPGDDRAAPARGARRRTATRSREVPRVRAHGQRGRDARGDAARAARASATACEPIPLEEVEPAKEIVKRFATGAMSLGLDLDRGARDARDRDEPPRRPVEHRRGRGGPAPLRRPTPTATCAARRSSRSPRAASA